MPHHEERVGVAAVLLGVIVNPADRLGDVACHLLDGHVRHEAIVGRDEDEALVHECLRLCLDVGLVAGLPAAAVNPEDDRVVLAHFRGVDIERLPLVLRLGVGDVTMHLRLVSESRGGRVREEPRCSSRWSVSVEYRWYDGALLT